MHWPVYKKCEPWHGKAPCWQLASTVLLPNCKSSRRGDVMWHGVAFNTKIGKTSGVPRAPWFQCAFTEKGTLSKAKYRSGLSGFRWQGACALCLAIAICLGFAQEEVGCHGQGQHHDRRYEGTNSTCSARSCCLKSHILIPRYLVTRWLSTWKNPDRQDRIV